jgi:hypothetical protein
VQDSAEITVASEATKQYLLQTPILISGERITIKIPAIELAANPQGLDALTTTILVRGLPIEILLGSDYSSYPSPVRYQKRPYCHL